MPRLEAALSERLHPGVRKRAIRATCLNTRCTHSHHPEGSAQCRSLLPGTMQVAFGLLPSVRIAALGSNMQPITIDAAAKKSTPIIQASTEE